MFWVDATIIAGSFRIAQIISKYGKEHTIVEETQINGEWQTIWRVGTSKWNFLIALNADDTILRWKQRDGDSCWIGRMHWIQASRFLWLANETSQQTEKHSYSDGEG